MAFLVGGANSSAVTAYDIDNSIRGSSTGSNYLSWTPDSAGNQKTFTYSAWFKRASLTTDPNLILLSGGDNTDVNRLQIYVTWAGLLRTDRYGTGTYDQHPGNLRDHSAWYHVVWRYDSTQSTVADISNMWLNGEEIALTKTRNFAEDDVWGINTAQLHTIGTNSNATTANFLEGYISEVFFIDGTAYDADDFGETDSASGIWKPKDAKDDLTFGTNGFYLEFKETGTSQNSSGLGADTSGNDNHWAVTNLAATDQTTDTPTNNFATLNPLWTDDVSVSALTYKEGNTIWYPTVNGNSFSRGTIGVSNGKWYMEMKVTEYNTGQSSSVSIVADTDRGNPVTESSGYGITIQLNASNTQLNKIVGGASTTVNSSFASASIAMLAIDLDNGKMWVGYDGTWWNDDNAASTLDASNEDGSGIAAVDYLIGFQAYWQTGVSAYNIAEINFGNPPFAISSGNADANGYGNFEFAVPSGFYALCTKNLAKYG